MAVAATRDIPPMDAVECRLRRMRVLTCDPNAAAAKPVAKPVSPKAPLRWKLAHTWPLPPQVLPLYSIRPPVITTAPDSDPGPLNSPLPRTLARPRPSPPGRLKLTRAVCSRGPTSSDIRPAVTNTTSKTEPGSPDAPLRQAPAYMYLRLTPPGKFLPWPCRHVDQLLWLSVRPWTSHRKEISRFIRHPMHCLVAWPVRDPCRVVLRLCAHEATLLRQAVTRIATVTDLGLRDIPLLRTRPVRGTKNHPLSPPPPKQTLPKGTARESAF